MDYSKEKPTVSLDPKFLEAIKVNFWDPGTEQ